MSVIHGAAVTQLAIDLDSNWFEETQSRSTRDLAGVCVVSLWMGGACFTSFSKRHRQKVIDFLTTAPPSRTSAAWWNTPPFWSQTASQHHLKPHNRAPCPPPQIWRQPLTPQSPPPLSTHLCLVGAAAAQRTERAAFTSEHISHQMSPFAARPFDIQADNALCILNIWLSTAPAGRKQGGRETRRWKVGWVVGLWTQRRTLGLKATSTVTPTDHPDITLKWNAPHSKTIGLWGSESLCLNKGVCHIYIISNAKILN